MVLKIGLAVKDVKFFKTLINEEKVRIQVLSPSDLTEKYLVDNFWDIIIWQPEFTNFIFPDSIAKYFNNNKNALLIICCSKMDEFKMNNSISNFYIFESDNSYSKSLLKLLLANVELLKKQESLYLKDEFSCLPESGFELIGESTAIKKINEFIRLISKTSNTHCLIRGEVGTEKKIVAKLIHKNCKTILGPLHFINCASYSPKQMSLKLFGADSVEGVKVENKHSALEMCADGTLVLENIEKLSEDVQFKLHIFLESQTFRRDESDFELNVNTRIIATTSHDLENFVKQGKILRELFYRFKAFELFIPPLRQRKCDIIPIANHFITFFNSAFGYNVSGISPVIEQQLIKYDWRGNVDELKVIIERAVLLTKEGEISNPALPENLGMNTRDEQELKILGNCSLREIEKRHIEKALMHTKGNKSKAAEILNISRTTLRDKLRTFNLPH